MGTVPRAWARIEDWMQQHAPASAALLAPPAQEARIAEAQAVLGADLPDELVDSLRRHDGLLEWGNVLPDTPPLSVAQLVEEWRTNMVAADEDGFTPVPWEEEPWWHPLWVPFAGSDGSAQILDLRPGPGYGRLGEWAHDGCGDFSEAWPSLAAYLTATADALDTGGEVRGSVAYVTVRGELWWAPPGETTLLDEPLHPAPRGSTARP